MLEKIKQNIVEIDKFKARIDNLLDMCSDGDISRETFKQKRDIIQSKITNLENSNKELQQQIKDNDEQDNKNKRLQVLSDFLKMNVYQKDAPIPDTIIEKYVQEIVVDKDNFIWKLNPNIGNTENLLLNSTRYNKKNKFSDELMCDVHCRTGSYQRNTLIEKPILLGTYRIPKNYMKSIIGFYYNDSDFRLPKEMEIQVQLI